MYFSCKFYFYSSIDNVSTMTDSRSLSQERDKLGTKQNHTTVREQCVIKTLSARSSDLPQEDKSGTKFAIVVLNFYYLTLTELVLTITSSRSLSQVKRTNSEQNSQYAILAFAHFFSIPYSLFNGVVSVDFWFAWQHYPRYQIKQYSWKKSR